MKITNQCIKMSKTSPHIRSCAPLLGQHKRKILQELGYNEGEIKEMEDAAVI